MGGAGGFSGFDFSKGFQGFEGFGEFGDLFDVFFGGQRGARRATKERGSDLRFDLKITLEEAAKGVEKELEIVHSVSCQSCKGTGAKPGTNSIKCSNCGGSGQIRKSQQTLLGSFTRVVPCPTCRGTGETISSPCPTCRGEGREKKRHNIKIKIPAGIDVGHRLRVAGAGDAGYKGGSAGDLYVFIFVQDHPLFNREGDHLYYRTKISFIQAILGDEIKFSTLDGEASLKIPAGTQPNTNFKLKGKGMPSLDHHERGHLFVLVEVEIPTKTTQGQEDLLKKFKNA